MDVRKRDGLREREKEFQPRRIVTVGCWYSENAADLSDATQHYTEPQQQPAAVSEKIVSYSDQ